MGVRDRRKSTVARHLTKRGFADKI